MGLFSFIKEAGEKLFGSKKAEEAAAAAAAQADAEAQARLEAANREAGDAIQAGYRARIRNHGHSCFLCEIVIRSQFHTTYEPEA
jgi:hypothetical protein